MSRLDEVKSEQQRAKTERDELMNKIDGIQANAYESMSNIEEEDENDNNIFYNVHDTSESGDEGEEDNPEDENEANENITNDTMMEVEENDVDLQEIYKLYEEDKETSASVDDKLAEFVNRKFLTGLSEETYKKMIDQHKPLRPENCKNLAGIKTNVAVWKAIPKATRNKDYKLQSIDRAVVRGGIWLTESVNELIGLQKKTKSTEVKKIAEKCNLALNMFAHTHHELNMFRREMIKPKLPPKFKDLCSNMLPYTDELFGEDIVKVVTELETQNKIKMKITPQYSRRDQGRGIRRGFRGRGLTPNYTPRYYASYHPYASNDRYYNNNSYRPKNEAMRTQRRRPAIRGQRAK